MSSRRWVHDWPPPVGSSGDPKSPHFLDQAKLLSECKTKSALFEWDEIRADARRNRALFTNFLKRELTTRYLGSATGLRQPGWS